MATPIKHIMNTLKKGLLITAVGMLMFQAKAQVSGNGISEYSAQGKLVILRIVPGDKSAKLFILGKKAAEIDLKKEAKVLAVFLNNETGSEQLKINNRGDFYEVKGIPKQNTPYELSVKTEVKGEKEDVTFKINMQKP